MKREEQLDRINILSNSSRRIQKLSFFKMYAPLLQEKELIVAFLGARVTGND
jgi:hypothetical protein